MKSVTFDILIEPEEAKEGFYSGHCTLLPGCYSVGRTPEETSTRMAESMGVHIATQLEHNEPLIDAATTGRTVKVEQLNFIIPVCRTN